MKVELTQNTAHGGKTRIWLMLIRTLDSKGVDCLKPHGLEASWGTTGRHDCAGLSFVSSPE